MKKANITPCKQPINFKNAKKCLAKTRKKTPCQSPAMKNGRCRMHGGKSTGAKTKEGRETIRQANFKHGLYTKDVLKERKYFSALQKKNKEFLNSIF